MTDRVRTLTVYLKEDYRTDDLEVVVNAIQLLEPVSHVSTQVVTSQDHIARHIARAETRRKVYEALFGDKGILHVK